MFSTSTASFVFPVGKISGGALPSLGMGYDPIGGSPLDAVGIGPVAPGSLAEQQINQNYGKYTSIRDHSTFQAAIKLGMTASGSGWGASVGIVADASCMTSSTATSYTIMYPGYLAQYSQSIGHTQALTDEAQAALKGGTFFADFGTHFVSGYVYGYTCNLAYVYQFNSEANYAAFSLKYSESESELGFNEQTSASIQSAVSASQTTVTISNPIYCVGFTPRPITQDMQTMAGAIEDFNAACKQKSDTPIMLIVEPWTSLDAVRKGMDPSGLSGGAVLQDFADLTNELVYIQQTIASFKLAGGYAGHTQWAQIRALEKEVEAELASVTAKLAAVANGTSGPLQPGDLDQFASPDPLRARMNDAMAKFSLYVKISDADVTSHCFDINGNPVTNAALNAGVVLSVDWTQSDDPYFAAPEVGYLVATGANTSVFYVGRDRSTGKLFLIAQASDSNGGQRSPSIEAWGSVNADPAQGLKWIFQTPSRSPTVQIAVV